MPHPRRHYGLTQQQWDNFLRLLDQDPEKAGQRYLRLQARFAKYFLYNNCGADPYDLADRAIDRLVSLLETNPIPASDIEQYGQRVAQIIRLEQWRFGKRLSAVLIALVDRVSPRQIDHECLEFSFKNLDLDERTFLESYYPKETPQGGVAADRQLLVGQFGPSYEAVRKRASAVVRKLRGFYRQCRDRKDRLDSSQRALGSHNSKGGR